MPDATPKRKQVSAAFAVLAIAGALVLVLLSAIVMLAWNSYADALAQARVRAASSAHVVSTHIEWLVAAGLQTLEEGDRLSGPDPTVISPQVVEEYRRHIRHLPPGVDLLIVGLDGKTLFSTAPDAGDMRIDAGLALAGLMEGRTWTISPMVIEPSGERSFLIARQIRRNGRMAAAAMLRMPASVMSDFWSSLDLGPGSTVGMLRDDGWLVARHPLAKEPQNLGNYILFTDLLKKSPTGVYDTRSPVDGMERIVGYRKVPNAPLVVVASVSRSYAMAQLNEQMLRLALFLVPLLIGLAALASWVAKLLKLASVRVPATLSTVERNNLLMREIHHRIKNNLQSVASLVKLQPIPDEAKTAMNGRIAAMSAVHEQAYRSDLYTEVNLREYLKLLIGNISKSTSGSITVDLRLADATIDRDLAQPLGLVVNEVISNAMKHAFEGREAGRIEVRLAMIGEDRAELVIHDDGMGHDPAAQASSGMGSRLIRAFAQQLGNDFDYADDNGTRFSIRFAAQARQPVN